MVSDKEFDNPYNFYSEYQIDKMERRPHTALGDIEDFFQLWLMSRKKIPLLEFPIDHRFGMWDSRLTFGKNPIMIEDPEYGDGLRVIRNGYGTILPLDFSYYPNAQVLELKNPEKTILGVYDYRSDWRYVIFFGKKKINENERRQSGYISQDQLKEKDFSIAVCYDGRIIEFDKKVGFEELIHVKVSQVIDSVLKKAKKEYREKQYKTIAVSCSGMPDTGKTTLVYNLYKKYKAQGKKVEKFPEFYDKMPIEFRKEVLTLDEQKRAIDWVIDQHIRKDIAIRKLMEGGYDLVFQDRSWVDAILNSLRFDDSSIQYALDRIQEHNWVFAQHYILTGDYRVTEARRGKILEPEELGKRYDYLADLSYRCSKLGIFGKDFRLDWISRDIRLEDPLNYTWEMGPGYHHVLVAMSQMADLPK